MTNGQTADVKGVRIEAVPMYNTHGETFHTKGRGNGYIVTIGGKRIYVAGDTACTDEMRALTRIDVAFLPMNVPWTMPPSEAADCARAFRPAIVYPYHFSGSNPDEFKQALQGTSIDVRLLDWY